MAFWLSDPNAPYVLAAYSVALLALLGLLVLSLRASWRAKSKLREIERQDLAVRKAATVPHGKPR